MAPCSRLIDSDRSADSVPMRLPVTWFIHFTIWEIGRRAPATSPALRNSAILSSFSLPETGFFTVSVCGSSGRFANRSRGAWNGSVLGANRTGVPVFPEFPVLPDRVGQPVAVAVLVEHGHD